MTYSNDSITVDGRELHQLTADLIYAAPHTVKKIEPIVKKAAQNIKKAMQADARKSRHFKQIASTVTYDVKAFEFGGDATIDAEIGYDKSVGPAAALAGLAIFGSSRPGGGTVRNPEEALMDEAPEFERWLEGTLDGIL